MINDALGLVDILINTAGGNHPKGITSDNFFDRKNLSAEGIQTFFKLDAEGLRFVMDLNFMGTLLPIQVFALDMMGREGCSILNVSSVAAFHPLTKVPAYSAAKAAISNFTEWLSTYFAKEGIISTERRRLPLLSLLTFFCGMWKINIPCSGKG